jgi:anti-sigma factor RsiW
MNPSPCQLLDDYVAHDLTGDDLARFEAHLPDCSQCHRAVREERQLDAMLSEAVTRLDPSPEGLSKRVERRLRVAQHRRVAAVVLASAASVVIMVLVGRFVLRTEPPKLTEQVRVQPEPPEPDGPPAAERVRVTFPAGVGVIAIPEPSESPNVTIIRVYTGLREPYRTEPVDEAFLPTPERSDP